MRLRCMQEIQGEYFHNQIQSTKCSATTESTDTQLCRATVWEFYGFGSLMLCLNIYTVPVPRISEIRGSRNKTHLLSYHSMNKILKSYFDNQFSKIKCFTAFFFSYSIVIWSLLEYNTNNSLITNTDQLVTDKQNSSICCKKFWCTTADLHWFA